MFSSTRDMLTKFLGTRAITDLRDEVNNATSSPAEEETPAPLANEAPTS